VRPASLAPRASSRFAPLGTVLVAMLGISVAEGSGLISAALRAVVLSAPPRLLTVLAFFAAQFVAFFNRTYSAAFFILWTLLLVTWYLFGLPLGPGAGLRYEPAS